MHQQNEPEPLNSNRPLLDWPNYESIMNRILCIAQSDTRNHPDPANEGDDPVLSPDQALQAAPDLPKQIHNRMDSHQFNDAILARLDQENENCARAVLQSLSPEQYQALVNASQAQMELEE